MLYVLLITTVWLTHLDLWVRISISSLIILSFLHHLLLDALKLSSTSWVSLSLNDNQLIVGLRSGVAMSGVLMQSSIITPACVVLCAKLDGYKLPIYTVIFRDTMPQEAFRQLRVRIRYQ